MNDKFLIWYIIGAVISYLFVFVVVLKSLSTIGHSGLGLHDFIAATFISLLCSIVWIVVTPALSLSILA